MATPAQIQANRRNAQHSTGPKTNAGKDKVRHNAYKHGLCAEDNLLPGEDPEEFADFVYNRRLEMEAVYYSIGGNQLINRAIRLEWKMRRIPKLEGLAMKKLIAALPEGTDPHEAMFAGLLVDADGQPTLAKLQAYEMRLAREIRACLKHLDGFRQRFTWKNVHKSYCDGYNQGVRDEGDARKQHQPSPPVMEPDSKMPDPCVDEEMVRRHYESEEAERLEAETEEINAELDREEAERMASEVEAAQAEHDATRGIAEDSEQEQAAVAESAEQSQFHGNEWPQQELEIKEDSEVDSVSIAASLACRLQPACDAPGSFHAG